MPKVTPWAAKLYHRFTKPVNYKIHFQDAFISSIHCMSKLPLEAFNLYVKNGSLNKLT